VINTLFFYRFYVYSLLTISVSDKIIVYIRSIADDISLTDRFQSAMYNINWCYSQKSYSPSTIDIRERKTTNRSLLVEDKHILFLGFFNFHVDNTEISH
jgi:hypothetical protein